MSGGKKLFTSVVMGMANNVPSTKIGYRQACFQYSDIVAFEVDFDIEALVLQPPAAIMISLRVLF